MFFIAGRGNTLLTTAPLPGVTCAHCGQTGTLSCSVFSRYASLFWIPLLPLGKMSVTVCRHCKQTLTDKEMPAAYRPPVQALESQAKVPLTNYALLLIFGALVVILMISGIFGHRSGAAASSAGQSVSAANTPVGGLYRIKADTGREYSLMQVNRVTADSVYVTFTQALRGPLSKASAAVALRDSLDKAMPHRQMTTTQWHYSTTGEGIIRPLTPAQLPD